MLYDRQRPRLRERVLQQCQAHGQSAVNHLDHVLDTQRNQLTDGADLNIARLEQDALRALGINSSGAPVGAQMAASQQYQQAPLDDLTSLNQPTLCSQLAASQPHPQAPLIDDQTSLNQSTQQYQQYQQQPVQQQYDTHQSQQPQYGANQQYTAANTGLYDCVPHHKMGGDYRMGDAGLPAPVPQEGYEAPQRTGEDATSYGIGNRILPERERLTHQMIRQEAEVNAVPKALNGRRSISVAPQAVHGRRSAGVTSTFPPAASRQPVTVRSQIPLDMGHYSTGGQAGRNDMQPAHYNPRAGTVDEFAVLAQRREAEMEQREMADVISKRGKQQQFYSDLKQQEDERAQMLMQQRQEDQKFHHQQVQQREQWRQQESADFVKQQQARTLGAQARVHDMEARRQSEANNRANMLDADRIALENLKRIQAGQPTVDIKQQHREHLQQQQEEIARERQRKEQQRQEEINHERELSKVWGQRLAERDHQRQAQRDNILARGNAQGMQAAGAFQAVAMARQADEQAFMQNLNRLEEIENRKALDKLNKSQQDQMQYRRDLDEQVQRKDVIQQRRQQQVVTDKNQLQNDLASADEIEARKQQEIAKRNNEYLHQIQAQMSERGGVDFSRHDIEYSKRAPFPPGYTKSRCDGSFFMSETERRMNGLA